MRKLIYIIILLTLVRLVHEHTVHTVLAVDYQYGFSLDRPITHFIVKPDFKNIGAEFTLSNSQDPVYLQLQFANQPNFDITIYDMDLDEIRAIDPKTDIFLLLPKTSRRFRVEISNKGNELERKDYIIDISALFKVIQIPKNIRRPVVIEPKIHKYIVLGVTDDGGMSLDPKIALFQNVNGAISLLQGPQNLVVTVQNRGNYILSLGGTLVVKGPNNFTQQNTIPPTYIFANSQKSLSVDGQDARSLISLPFNKLTTGRYTASIDLTVPGSNTPHLYGQTSFWLISPFYVIASVIFCLMMITIIFILGIRRT